MGETDEPILAVETDRSRGSMDTLADLRTNSCFNKVRNFNYREVALYKVCSDSQAKPVVHRSPDCLDKEDGGAGSLQERMIEWSRLKEAKSLPRVAECLTIIHLCLMNIIIWNSRGALKPNFQDHVRNLAQNFDSAIFVIMETKLGGDRARAITDRLPFDGDIHSDMVGYAGGLWLLWNADKVEVQRLANTKQEIHVEVKVRSSNLTWLFSAIYASPRSGEKIILWNNLAKIAKLHNLPWVMAGDFNEPLLDADKFGGRGVNINWSLLFKDCLDKCSMVDLGFSGPRYTWTNKRKIKNLILERIDRFFMNPDWCVLYPEAKITHLPRCHSDHCPVLLETCPSRAISLTRPFRFQEF